MLSFLNDIDNFFCRLEGKKKHAPLNGVIQKPAGASFNTNQQPKVNKQTPKENAKKIGLGSILYNLFVSKEYKDQGLDGWREDKEKFKVDLINDIKTFLFTKWEKPWRTGLIFDKNGKVLSGFRNISGRVYRNQGNIMSLSRKSGDSPFFITLSKLNKLGGKILDKLKTVWVISYIPIYKDVKLSGDDTEGRSPDFMLPQFHQVINLDFVEGIEKPTYKTVEFEKLELNEYVENFVNELKRLKRLPPLHYDQSDNCFYRHSKIGWSNESIHLVPINSFKNIEGYYSVLFHEITHSTANPKRCGRGKFKNDNLTYANEELVAEMGAMIICEELGLKYQRQNSLSYLNGWLKQAKGSDIDSALIEAYAYACDAADYLLEGINLDKLVPKTLAKRAEEEETNEPKTAKPESQKPSESKATENKTILPRTKPNELSYELAYRAHTGTSFSPEKRAKSHQEEYANSLNSYAEQFEALVKSEEQKSIAIEEFERFKKGYTDKYNAWLRAKSNCISPMITGPSKFPTRKAEKANQAEERRLEEFIKWEKKAVKTIEARIKGKTPQEIIDNERWKRLKREVIERLATIVEIEQGKAPYSKPLIVAALKRYLMAAYKARNFSDFSKALELVKEAQEKFKMTVFAPNNPIWKLQPIAEAEPKNKETETIYKAVGCDVLNNYQAQRVQMAFNGKPAAEVITTLKKSAFKWSPSQKVWQRKNTRAGIYAALDIAKKYFPSNEPTPEPEKPTTKPKSTKLEVVDFPIKDIYTDEKRFQNRVNAFSEDSKDRIIKAFESGTFDWTKFDPITLWKDPENGKYFVLSGHSRYAAFKEKSKEGFVYDGYGFANIPARIFKGSEAQAIDFALNSNTLSTKETEVERALYYNKQRSACELKKGLSGKTDCEKQVEKSCRDAEGKNANYILNLSYLNPNGYLIDSLARLGIEKDNDSTNLLRTIANWIGEARRNNPEITDAQETEIAQFLINGGYGNKAGQFRNKTQFNERLKDSFSKWKANGSDPSKPLNLANTLSKTSFEKEWDERLAKAKEELDNAIAEHEEKYKKYLFAVMDGSLTQARMDELMKPIVAYVEKSKKEYERVRGQKDEVKKASNAQQSLWGVDDVNSQFNRELDLLIQGKLPKNHIFNLGMPSDALLGAGIPNLPIELSSSRLLGKSIQKEHPFDLNIVKNLPHLISEPLIVFTSATKSNSFVVVAEIAHKGRNFVIPIRINWSNGEKTVNSVRSVHYRNTNVHIINWINAKLHVWANKKNTLNWLSKQRYNSADVKQLIKSATNIIQNFNNPAPTPNNLNGENKNLFGLQPIASTKKSKTYRLRGDLGQFLGEYDRNSYTIVLRGDKGAGKSRLLYQLINAFAGKLLRVAFLSLEMANNSSITQRYKSEYISKTNLKRIDIADQAPTYDDLNAICKGYDVVAIDSWTKLKGITQQDFDRLQKENPNTIIICIFQSTTGKITRGGNMPEYDAGTVIQVNKGGLAECEKNRYAPTDKVYNVFTKSLEPTEEPENV